MKREAFLGAATVLLCAVLYYQTTLIADYGFAQVGADVWPKMILGAIAALALLQMALGLYRPRSRVGSEVSPAGARPDWRGSALVPLTVFGAIIGFALLVPFAGFTVSGLLMVFVLLTVIGPKTPRAIAAHAAIAAVSVLSVAFFFSYVMGVLLPGWAL
ncbi:tripartite tricarboxylate transporter TctB family protein [Pararhodobacter oceanensis]|uniref:tripartite tricarboxylate transporter TctB family protein n=1 Tax=Pararhodobacter oceanensis TaxID=2172121 RepID=UPI003A8F8B96